MVLPMKTKVKTHEGVDIYRVDVRGDTFYKSDLVFGEHLTGKDVDEVAAKITAKRVLGDRRVLFETHEGINIYQVRDGGKTYFICDPVHDEVFTGNTAHDVALSITRLHAILGYY